MLSVIYFCFCLYFHVSFCYLFPKYANAVCIVYIDYMLFDLSCSVCLVARWKWWWEKRKGIFFSGKHRENRFWKTSCLASFYSNPFTYLWNEWNESLINADGLDASKWMMFFFVLRKGTRDKKFFKTRIFSIDFLQNFLMNFYEKKEMWVCVSKACGGTYLGSGKIIFLLARAAGVHFDFSIAIK